jgi:membrane dipeptidase
VRAFADVSRKMDDEQLRALKKNGGVIQIVAFASAEQEAGPGRGDAALATLTPERRAEYEKRLAALDAKLPPADRPNVKDMVDHIDYAVKLIGIDHVGISSDFYGGGEIHG